LKTYKIPVPPLSVQQEIVVEIEGYEADIAACQKIINEASEKKKAVLEKYL
jgi:restriction endonuclease S subunit